MRKGRGASRGSRNRFARERESAFGDAGQGGAALGLGDQAAGLVHLQLFELGRGGPAEINLIQDD